MKRLQIALSALALIFAGSAQADTVRLELGGLSNGSLEAWFTLSGANIVSGASRHYFADAENMSFQADFGEGLVDFDVLSVTGTLPSYLGDNGSGSYSLYSMTINLVEDVTNPGSDTTWTFDQSQDIVPGVEDDYYAYLRNSSTGSRYGQSWIAPAYWTEVAAVPIPAAAWLFASALAGLGWLRRKQTV